MKKNKLILSCILLVWNISSLQAQNNLLVNLNDSTQLVYPFSNVKNLTFLPGKLSVNKADGMSEVKSMFDIRNILLQSGTPLANQNSLTSLTTLSVYPNPASTDEVKIEYELLSAQPVYIELLNVRSEFQQQLLARGKAGINTVALNIEGLAAGIYLCRISSGDFVKTTKIIRY